MPERGATLGREGRHLGVVCDASGLAPRAAHLDPAAARRPAAAAAFSFFYFANLGAVVRALETAGVEADHMGCSPHALGGEVRIRDPGGNTLLLSREERSASPPAGRRALVTVLPAARGRGRRRGEWRHHHGRPGGRAARAAVPEQGRSEARRFRWRLGRGVHHARRRDPGQGAGGVRRQPGDEGIAGFRPAAAVNAQLPDTPAGKPRIKL